jgi:hypothetical protein
MKKIIILLMLIPVLGISQSNVVSSFKVFPKVDKSQEFEKALIAHVQKYHTGDWKWNVWEVQSGPDYGSFMVVEGPLSWDQFDKRGTLGDAHTTDWAKNVAPFTTERGVSIYSEFSTELSNVGITDYADKILINHMLPKPGKVVDVASMIGKLKKVWTEGKEVVAVYSTTGSGAPEFLTVTRLKNGLKELSDDYRKPMSERFNASHGEGSWNYFLSDYSKNVESRWSELLFKRADLSSK